MKKKKSFGSVFSVQLFFVQVFLLSTIVTMYWVGGAKHAVHSFLETFKVTDNLIW